MRTEVKGGPGTSKDLAGSGSNSLGGDRYDGYPDPALAAAPPVTSTLWVMLVATSVAAVVIVFAMTAIVVVAVLGLFVWGAIQDGREERALKEQRKRRTPPDSTPGTR